MAYGRRPIASAGSASASGGAKRSGTSRSFERAPRRSAIDRAAWGELTGDDDHGAQLAELGVDAVAIARGDRCGGDGAEQRERSEAERSRPAGQPAFPGTVGTERAAIVSPSSPRLGGISVPPWLAAMPAATLSP